MSDDGTKAVSLIAFIGSVFSPWYKWSGRREPQNHCCLNVVTSGLNGRFTMTDRGRSALKQSPDRLEIGPSSVTWTGQELVIEVNEWGAPPMVTPVTGRVILTPRAVTQTEVLLTPDGAHLWRPFAPIADIEVQLSQGHSWRGHGYFDANFGTRALEADFAFWTWGRYPLQDRTLCFYDAELRDGTHFDLAVQITPDGQVVETTAPPRTRFARNPWAVRRETRADPGIKPRPHLSLLEAPFYSRALVETQIDGEKTVGMHEALDLTRFRQPLLKPMLAVRVPRRANWP
ncbi:MAG: carotenoid 1,2-hydratase [Pseudomonadota bacterium]